MMNFIKNLFGNTNTNNLSEIISQGAFLVDVRTTQEFAESKIKGAVNIPLDKIALQIEKFKNKNNIVVFCRSGNRSGQAKAILERSGIINVINGGSFGNIKQHVK
ncbi:MAG: rhodanese-like domain-containing protein [Saprospirales bacterium]|nr:rhodanese-like domain-containing protein [Saprospirales bacterium]MBK8353355.1 rhodanese-like domain-containing protein [Saprospirales bacterium]